MYGCESWTIKKAEHWRIDVFWTVVLEKTLESPLDCKEIQPVHSKGNQSWMFIVRTNSEPETPMLWPHRVKSWLIWKDPDDGKDWNWLIWKDPDDGKDWRQEENGMKEDEMVGCHQPSGHESEWTLGVGDGQGGLAFCSPWGHKELDMTEWLNWTELRIITQEIVFQETLRTLPKC